MKMSHDLSLTKELLLINMTYIPKDLINWKNNSGVCCLRTNHPNRWKFLDELMLVVAMTFVTFQFWWVLLRSLHWTMENKWSRPENELNWHKTCEWIMAWQLEQKVWWGKTMNKKKMSSLRPSKSVFMTVCRTPRSLRLCCDRKQKVKQTASTSAQLVLHQNPAATLFIFMVVADRPTVNVKPIHRYQISSSHAARSTT